MTTYLTAASPATRRARASAGRTGRPLPFSDRTLWSELMATTSTSPSRRAPWRYLTCPTCSTSKQPLASTTRSPRALCSATLRANGSSGRILFRESILTRRETYLRREAHPVGDVRGDEPGTPALLGPGSAHLSLAADRLAGP